MSARRGEKIKMRNYGESRKTIEIFRAGRHTASDGSAISFSRADLAASARAYYPEIHEAPLVIGHPKMNDPAYGRVTDLALSGDSLYAEADDVDPEFVDLVRAGRFRKISASFYMPGSPQNPVPGVYYLRHVGFLGAQPPAVKGLSPIAFREYDRGSVSFLENFEDYPTISEGRDRHMAHGTREQEEWLDNLIKEGKILKEHRGVAGSLLRFLEIHDGPEMLHVEPDGRKVGKVEAFRLLLNREREKEHTSQGYQEAKRAMIENPQLNAAFAGRKVKGF
jgi:hypothetical protein